uniref:ABI family, member 3 (NESH) binding protein a n=1 Tax=Astyanax mexicanus TaxID=7994 RepID=A0A8B9GP03_ASTMX
MRDFIIFIFITQVLLLNLLCTSAARVRRETLMVRINATGDTIVLKFIRPHEDTKLEGYILGYGKSMFSKQYIQLPENGEAYETEIEAEPKYLIAVKSVKANEVKKPCPEKVNLEKPLHLVIGSVTPTSVLLSWGTLLKTPYTDTQLDDCLEESLFTVRYREEEPNKHWNYQTCPGTSTVIDNLKPDTQYEFGVREDNNGWTHSVIHSTADVGIHELLQPKNLLKTQEPIVKALTTFPPTEPVQYSTAHSSTTPLLKLTEPPTVSSTTLGTGSDEITSSTSTEDPLFLTQTASSIHTPTSQSPSKTTDTFQPQQSTISPPSTTTQQQQRTTQQQQPTTQYTTSTTETQPSTSTTTTQVTTTEPPSSTTESRPSTTETTGQSVFRNSTTPAPVIRSSTRRVKPNGNPRRRVPPKAVRLNPPFKNTSLDRVNGHSGEKHKGMLLNKPAKEPRRNNGPPANPISGRPKKNRLNQVEKLIEKDKTVPDLKKESLESRPILKPHLAPTTEKPVYIKPTPTITPCFSFNGSCFGSGDNSSVFSSVPVSDVDATGKKRYVAPHVIYKTDKPPEQPCSVTDSLSYFPEEEAMNINVTGPPKNAPSNLTVVTVEGCPSFVILDWEKTDNETTEYEVTSSTKGPKGKEVSLITTNQTHTAVENLKPESNYEFTVTPKNDLGSGPSSEPVKFSTESVDPRVTDIPTGKNAIWSSFPFKAADSYSECIGRMFVKRTWYRKYVGIQLCNSLRYKIYLSDSLKGKFYNIGDQTGNGEDHCQFVDSFLDGRTGGPLSPNRLPPKDGFFRAVRQEPVQFGQIGGNTHINYVAWYECGVPIPGSW